MFSPDILDIKKIALLCLKWTFAEVGNPFLPQSLPTGEGREPLAAKESTSAD